ncbi:PQQ-binding-like beta-propeller repeat protein [Halorientalis pallida]|uniref:outer membrane protein assembly factor BamB family protein n=1 Tax=Halorientalis pallida TaxID=2479928 RepID=UPI003C6FC497
MSEKHIDRSGLDRRSLLRTAGALAAGSVVSTALTGTAGAEATGSDWVQHQADEGNTGHHTDVSPPTADPSVAWSYETEDTPLFEQTDHNPFQSNVVVVDGTAYAACSKGLFAFDTADGSVEWTFYPGTKWSQADALAHSGDAILASRWNYLTAHDPGDGSILWSYETSSETGDGPSPGVPTVSYGITFIAARTGIRALDSYDGSVYWQYSDLNSEPDPALVGDYLYHWPVVEHQEGVVAIQSENDVLHAVDPFDGTLRWTADVGDGSTVNTPTPAATDGTIYVVDNRPERGFVRAIDAADGSELWATGLSGRMTTSPAVADGKVYVTSQTGSSFHAIDASSGTVDWTANVQYRAEGSPVVADGHVYLGLDFGKLLAFDTADGTQTISLSLSGTGDDGVTWPAALQDGAIFTAVGDKLHKLTGE